MYQIKVLEKKFAAELQLFIKNNWNPNHIFVTSQELLLWQHGIYENLNFVVAYSDIDNHIIAALGFIPTNYYDRNLNTDELDLWLALWKGNESYPGVGMDLFNYLKTLLCPISIGAIGINENVKRIYKLLKFEIGYLNHYYFANSNNNVFKICSIDSEKVINSNNLKSDCKIDILDSVSNLQKTPRAHYRPFKSINYLICRYENHPFYNYKFWMIKKSTEETAILVVRKIQVDDSFCFRIIDVLGDLSRLNNLSAELHRILVEENAEYVDFLNYGIDEKVFYNLGFMKKNEAEIIPNYFEPFSRSNNNIQFAYKSHFEPYIIFKGDSDQDRPNLLKNEL
jgi:hypothetical protein